jgi:uncharacterized protein
MITLTDAEELINLARKTVESEIHTSQKTTFSKKIEERFSEKYGLFVTIHKNNELRGCIGIIQPVYPLYEGIIHLAKSAAFEDPRFTPISAEELNDLEYEISILTEPEKVSLSKEEIPGIIRIGKHGLIIKKGPYSGLLLPQVAKEHRFSPKQFLEQTCLKAGLDPNEWEKEDTEIYIFSAQVFKEEEGTVVEEKH